MQARSVNQKKYPGVGGKVFTHQHSNVCFGLSILKPLVLGCSTAVTHTVVTGNATNSNVPFGPN